MYANIQNLLRNRNPMNKKSLFYLFIWRKEKNHNRCKMKIRKAQYELIRGKKERKRKGSFNK